MNMDKESAKLALRPKGENGPKIEYKIQRKKNAGTKELKTVAKALDGIHRMIEGLTEVLMRTDEKEGEIAGRLSELTDAIRNSDYDQDQLEEILKDLDERTFEEKVFTEKCGKGTIRMTTATKMSVIGKALSEAAKIASTKQKMSGGEYVAIDTVVAKAQENIDEMQKILYKSLPRQMAADAMSAFMEKAVKIWDDLS